MMTNSHNTTLYVGVTNELKRRAHEHRTGAKKGFTSNYNLAKLVYYEIFEDINQAITREKQLKGGSRKKKDDLVDAFNPTWRDLFEDVSTF
jgi:putative endonuclease